jgi:hypothetical protein
MNERIADILEQAFDLCKKYDDEGKTGLVRTTEAFYIFADLIIKECAKAVDDTPLGYEDYRSQIEKVMRNYCRNNVLEHFGIDPPPEYSDY